MVEEELNGHKCYKCGGWIFNGIWHICPEPPPDTRQKVYCIDCKSYIGRWVGGFDRAAVTHSYCKIYDISRREDPVNKVSVFIPVGGGSFLGNKDYHCPKYIRANWWSRLWR